jgi:hypothetical protein
MKRYLFSTSSIGKGGTAVLSVLALAPMKQVRCHARRSRRLGELVNSLYHCEFNAGGASHANQISAVPAAVFAA